MSLTSRLLTCLLLILALAAAPATLASPADSASSPWWAALSELWSWVLAATPGLDDGTNMGPEIDPDGTALSNSDDGGETTPEIDPDGLTVLPGHDPVPAVGNRGPAIDPEG